MTICKSICQVDEETNTMCIACGRTLEEITEWYNATQERKKEIAYRARERNSIRKMPVLDVDYHLREYD